MMTLAQKIEGARLALPYLDAEQRVFIENWLAEAEVELAARRIAAGNKPLWRYTAAERASYRQAGGRVE